MSKIAQGRERVIEILMKRDELMREEAEQLLDDVLEQVESCFDCPEDAEEVWMSKLGLEVDYLLDVLL